MDMRFRKYLPTTLLCLVCSLVVVKTTTSEDGSHTAEFLSHGVGARALGMGSAFVSIADDATAAYWNPAGLATVEKHAFSAMYSDSFGTGGGNSLNDGLLQYNFANYVQHVEGFGSLAVSWIRLGIDDIPLTTFSDTNGNGILGDFQDRNGNGIKEEGELYIDRPEIKELFSNTDNALLISYACQVNRTLALGGNLKLLKQSIFENSGTGFGLDLGLIVEPVAGLRIGAMLEDATGTQVEWDTETGPTFTREPQFRLGASFQIALPLIGTATVGTDLQTSQKDLDTGDDSISTLLRFGAEYWLFNTIAFRVGAHDSKLAAGAGFRLHLDQATMFADYAFNAHEIGDSQRISISGLF